MSTTGRGIVVFADAPDPDNMMMCLTISRLYPELYPVNRTMAEGEPHEITPKQVQSPREYAEAHGYSTYLREYAIQYANDRSPVMKHEPSSNQATCFAKWLSWSRDAVASGRMPAFTQAEPTCGIFIPCATPWSHPWQVVLRLRLKAPLGIVFRQTSFLAEGAPDKLEVDSFTHQSKARAKGLQVGDRLASIDGKKVKIRVDSLRGASV
jgi:hypothetical protein